MHQPLAEVADIYAGYPFRGKVSPEEGGDVVVVQIKDIDALTGLTVDAALRLRSAGGRFDRYLLAVGDVLFQSRGSRHPVAVVSAPLRGIASLGVHVLRPRASSARPAYLAWYLNHPKIQAQLKEIARGSHIPFIGKRDLEEFSVSIPSLKMQDRIVAVDGLSRQIRSLETRLGHLQQQYSDAVTWVAATPKAKKRT
jgi:type I restriction modification DNA specificity protein